MTMARRAAKPAPTNGSEPAANGASPQEQQGNGQVAPLIIDRSAEQLQENTNRNASPVALPVISSRTGRSQK